jgi:hypothetical protein
MAEALVVVQQIVPAGAVITFEAPNVAGNYFLNDGRTVFRVLNVATQAIVTVHGQGLCDQGFEHDQTATIVINKTTDVGPFDTKRFNLNGYVHVTYDNITSITVAAVKV